MIPPRSFCAHCINTHPLLKLYRVERPFKEGKKLVWLCPECPSKMVADIVKGVIEA